MGVPVVYFHVGLGKTGTKFLQYNVFPYFRGIEYIQRTRYARAVELIRRGGAGRYFVSNEFDQQLEREVKYFSGHFPDARVIIVFRQQDGWIASQYRRFVKNGFPGPFREFFDIRKDEGWWKQEELYYLPKIRLVEDHFTQPPLVLIYEDMRKDPMAFIDRIARFLGAEYEMGAISLKPKHTSYSKKQLHLRRKVSQLFGRPSYQYSSNKILHWLQVRSRLLFSYLVMYSAVFWPDSHFREPLIPQDELDEVRKHYAADWEAVLKRADRV